MKRNAKMLLAVLLMLAVTVSAVSGLSAAAAVKGRITVGSAKVQAGKSVTVTVTMDVNPGIATADFELMFDTDALTLTAVKDEGFIPSDDAHYAGPAHSDQLVSPYHLSWCNDIATSNITKTGKLVTLTFTAAENAKPGEYSIAVVPESAELYDCNTKPVAFDFTAGTITVKRSILGDVDGDGAVTTADATFILRKVSQEAIPFTIDDAVADADGNGQITPMDATYIQRWLADLQSNDNIGKPLTR